MEECAQVSRLLSLARETARTISRSPGVVAVALTGSLATGQTRDGSDIDLAVYWKTAPTAKDLDAVQTRLGGLRGDAGKDRAFFPGRASEGYAVQGVLCDLSHSGVGFWEADMDAVLVDHAVPHPAQGLLAGLLDAVPLYGHALHQSWQDRARAYPDGLARRMVEVHLPVSAYACLLGDAEGGLGDKLVGDGNLLMRHELRLQSAYGLLATLAGLNRLYWPGGKRIDRLIARMAHAPRNLWPRLQAVFSDPLPGVGITRAAEELDALWNETYPLVERLMPELVKPELVEGV